MSLAQRLMMVTVGTTLLAVLLLGFAVRNAWQGVERERYEREFARATGAVRANIEAEFRELPELLVPLCNHNPLIDSTLLDIESERLDAGKRLSLSLRVAELMRALRLDELTLFSGTGEILGAGHNAGLIGTRDAALARLRANATESSFVASAPPRIVSHCVHARGSHKVGLLAARHVESMLNSVTRASGIRLSLSALEDTPERVTHQFDLPGFDGLTLSAEQSSLPLARALQSLDRTILYLGSAVLLVSLLFTSLLARRLVRPIAELSRQARRVVEGEPEPVAAPGGGRELTEFATAFNQAIQRLAALRQRLAASERMTARREIAQRVAHEIKNPLLPIRAAIETLRRLRARNDPAFDEYFDEATRTVLGEVERITNIVQEFTLFARLPPANPESIDAVEVISNLVRLYARDDTEIIFEAGRLDPVIADKNQLIQVCTNLLQNAQDSCLESAAAGGAKIWVALAQAGQVLQLTVRDNGRGVSPEQESRLFSAHFTTKLKGNGLGLAIVRQIVSEHGGRVVYESPAEGGALFRVELPLGGPASLASANAPASRPT